MKQDLGALNNQVFDLIIVGGGINGVACAWDAALRGYRVALFEKGDFGAQTSSQSAKIAHSGIRYLQHADFARMRESIRERMNLTHNVPHIVRAQPFLLPIYGHGLKGRQTMTLYMKMFNLFSMAGKNFADPARQVPKTRIISPGDVLGILPEIEKKGLTGGAVWSEGLMHNTERLLYSYVRSAEDAGALMFNYCDVKSLVHDKNKVRGVRVEDRMEGRSAEVQASVVINATGPWLMRDLGLGEALFGRTRVYPSKAFSLVTRQLCSTHAVSFYIKPMYADKKAVVDKKSSMQFAIPWKGHSLICSLHLPCPEEDPDGVTITDAEITEYLRKINEGYPGANLEKKDIVNILWGVIPAEEKGSAAPLKHYRIVDHRVEDHISGIISVGGVKYTTSRDVAEKTVNFAEDQITGRRTPCKTLYRPLWGGNIGFLDAFFQEAFSRHPDFHKDIISHLVINYGRHYDHVLEYAKKDPILKECIAGTTILKAEIVHACRKEKAKKLTDVVMRRTELGSVMMPTDETLTDCAQIMAGELGWGEKRMNMEIDGVKEAYLWHPQQQ